MQNTVVPDFLYQDLDSIINTPIRLRFPRPHDPGVAVADILIPTP
jgi:hypothetical protein